MSSEFFLLKKKGDLVGWVRTDALIGCLVARYAGWSSPAMSCVYRKPKPGRNGDEARL